MLKHALLILTIVALWSCSSKRDQLIGQWEVNNKFYHAIYEISEEGENLAGQVLYYNDGTTSYNYKDGAEKHYVFKNLIQKEERFVDGVSGATSSNDEQEPQWVLEFSTEQSLKVQKMIMDKPLTEYWYKRNK
jgi:hypothetical protein